MCEINQFLKKWLLSVVGKKLTDVFALVYVYEGEEDLKSPQKLDLRFESNCPSVLDCVNDGSGLRLSNECLAETDLGEYGREVIKNLSREKFWGNFLNKIVTDVKIIISGREKDIIGIFFEFQSQQLIIANLGDEIYVYEELPEEIKMEENPIFLPVC